MAVDPIFSRDCCASRRHIDDGAWFHRDDSIVYGQSPTTGNNVVDL